jgi:hypothetical protein
MAMDTNTTFVHSSERLLCSATRVFCSCQFRLSVAVCCLIREFWNALLLSTTSGAVLCNSVEQYAVVTETICIASSICPISEWSEPGVCQIGKKSTIQIIDTNVLQAPAAQENGAQYWALLLCCYSSSGSEGQYQRTQIHDLIELTIFVASSQLRIATKPTSSSALLM